MLSWVVAHPKFKKHKCHVARLLFLARWIQHVEPTLGQRRINRRGHSTGCWQIDLGPHVG